jgi:hypothetical protein
LGCIPTTFKIDHCVVSLHPVISPQRLTLRHTSKNGCQSCMPHHLLCAWQRFAVDPWPHEFPQQRPDAHNKASQASKVSIVEWAPFSCCHRSSHHGHPCFGKTRMKKGNSGTQSMQEV